MAGNIKRVDAFRVVNWLQQYCLQNKNHKSVTRAEFLALAIVELELPKLNWQFLGRLIKDANITLPKFKETRGRKAGTNPSPSPSTRKIANLLLAVVRNQKAIATQLGIELPEPVDETPLKLIIGSGILPELPENLTIVP